MSRTLLIAGAGGVLGRSLVEEFNKKGIKPRGMALFERELTGMDDKLSSRIFANVTEPESLHGTCDGVDIVVSVIGIGRIKGKLTHMDVDYKGNMNLLAEAKRAGVKKFVFISPAGTEIGAAQGVPLMEAKFRFEEQLKISGLDWVIVRAGGFMSDFAEMGKMARQGAMYLIGNGNIVSTPVDVKDLAVLMAEDALSASNQYTSIGGPHDLTWRQIYETCFKVWDKPARISSMPVWLCRLVLFILRPFSAQYYALGKLILFFSVTDVPTQRRGSMDLETYLRCSYSRKT